MTIKSRVALALLCGSPLMASAVGLGDIRLSSALNQPFVADIDLLSVSADELKQLHASLSSPEMFASHGVDRPAFLSSMTFKVATDRAGHAVLQVRTPEVVTEPFVTLLIEVSWPQGRLVREYTVLLDPPVFADHPAVAPRLQAPVSISSSDRPVVAAVAQSSAAPRVPAESTVIAPQAKESAPAKASRVTERRASPTPMSSTVAPLEPMTATGQVYEVAPGDSLSGIGRRTAGIAQAQMNRWMVATFRSNQKAFDGNINRLKKHAVLTLPTETEWSSIDAAVAASQVHQQASDWGTGVRPSAVASTATQTPEVARLRLVPSKEATADSQAVASQALLPGGVASTAASASTQQADKATDSSAAARLVDLQKEVADAKRALELKTTELAELERGAAPVATPVAAAPAIALPPVIATPAVQAGPIRWLVEYAAWLIGALLALGVGAWLVISRRRTQAEERFQETIAMPTPAAWGAAEPTGFGSIHAGADSRKENDQGATRQRAAATGVTVTATDPLAEADFHIAYGLYGQAADLLKQALLREPAERAFQLKLLEVYYVAGNADEFLTLAQILRDSAEGAGPGEWQNILLMGAKLLPQHPLFAQAAVAQRDRSLDFDLGEAEVAPREAKPVNRVRPTPPVARPLEDSKLDDTHPRLPKLKEGVVPPSMAELGLDLDKLLAESSVSSDATAQFKSDDDARFKVRDLVDQAAEGSSAAVSKADLPKARDVMDATAQTMALETLTLDDLGLKATDQDTLSAMTTKLELARAYLAMGDTAGARSLAEDVIKGGSASEISDAQQLLKSLS